MRRIYHTDGSTACFFTAVFDAYLDKTAYLSSENGLQLALGDTWQEVVTDKEKAVRVGNKLKQADGRALLEIDRILRSNSPEKEQIAYRYLRLVIKYGSHAREKLALDEVRAAMDICAQVGYEIHRLHGFLRFQEHVNGAFYAKCAPDNDIVDLLMPHFVARFKKTSFVIHDVKRGLACLYNGSEWIEVTANEAGFESSEQEQEIESLWKKYYHTVEIPARKNTRQMKNYMPTRYWKFMLEKEGDDL